VPCGGGGQGRGGRQEQQDGGEALAAH
jgi:hypothetical protein